MYERQNKMLMFFFAVLITQLLATLYMAHILQDLIEMAPIVTVDLVTKPNPHVYKSFITCVGCSRQNSEC